MKKSVVFLPPLILGQLFIASNSLAENELDSQTGLIVAQGYQTVKANCTACHGASLVTQNHATRDGWLSIIRWMQSTQNLWQFTQSDEKVILDYLAKHYPPTKTGRRRLLEVKEWYPLKDDAA